MVGVRSAETPKLSPWSPRRTWIVLFASAFVFFLIVTALLFDHEVTRIQSEKAERAASIREVPDFALVDQTGRVVRRRHLLGKVWLVGLVAFSEGVHGVHVTEMSRVVSRLAGVGDFRAVLITADPDRDSPDQLGSFVESLSNSDRWIALTGEPARVVDLIRVGFGGDVGEERGSVQIQRSAWVGVIDRKGRLRASFDATGEHFQEQVLTSIKHVLSER